MLDINEGNQIKEEEREEDYLSQIPLNGVPGWDFPELHGVNPSILVATTGLLIILSVVLIVISNRIT